MNMNKKESILPNMALFDESGDYKDVYPDKDTGLTIRDYFAGQALVGFMTSKHNHMSYNPEDIAEYVYEIADAMLKERD